ncbi:hypothetical protein ZIOFF_034369 [Zingiber officinale]|uniref:Uncharacterized protein n=1 Tax=Zingiber officinale TaxID=94328 RepID=A0A8J5LCU5_ZINOF|nr:hypothetical protein ZIOFF_034369 [Zingiber officinale]
MKTWFLAFAGIVHPLSYVVSLALLEKMLGLLCRCRFSCWHLLVSELYSWLFLFGAHCRTPDDRVLAIELDALHGEPLQQRPLRVAVVFDAFGIEQFQKYTATAYQ